MSYWHKKSKTLREFRKKTTKKNAEIGSVEQEKSKHFSKMYEQCDEHVIEKPFQKLTDRFSIGQKIDLIDRKSHWIDPTPIKNRSSQADSNLIFCHIFDRSSNRFDQSKI